MNQPLPLAFPDFIYAEPTLAPGGGAEVVSLANPSWFTNNGFSADFSFAPLHSSPSIQNAPFHDHLSTPFGFPDQPPPQPPPALPIPDFTILRRHIPPPLPVYSASGFDLLSILARVATRPNPRVLLGSVDLKCSFVIVDTRRFDHPIVYCSPSFCTLTGYSEEEIIGRNCRFLQAPAGDVRKGDPRQHTSQEAVTHLRKSLVANKECQTTIRNFRKDGRPFMNLLTVIPLSGGVPGSVDEENEYVYHVGFQVDLAQQPNAILEKLNHGSYLVNYSREPNQPSPTSTKVRKPNNLPPLVMSKVLRKLIADPAFIGSIPLSTSTTTHPSLSSSSPNQDDPVTGAPNQFLHLLLLEAAPDFIHVVSLKGSFLYVAPSVRRVLGYEPEDMVGKAISDFAHPKDVVPLMRELKESSATGGSAEGGSHAAAASPRTVNLLFRARTKMGNYVWIESRGRLHVEPGKGRKAIVLSGRAREMSRLTWEEVKFAGGLTRGRQGHMHPSRKLVEQEVWGMISGHRKETMTFLSVGQGVEDVLGWSADELIGRNVMDLVLDEGARSVIGGIAANMKLLHCNSRHWQSSAGGSTVRRVHCALRKKGNGVADVWFIIYRAEGPTLDGAGSSISPVPLVYQIRLVEARTILPDLAPNANNTTILSPPPSYDKSSDISSSSLAGAVPILKISSSASPATTTMDMFEELAISKDSSWQYELQQLRFANVRLREELATLQVPFDGESGRAGDDSRDFVLDESTLTAVHFPSTLESLGDERIPKDTPRQEDLHSNSFSSPEPSFNRQLHSIPQPTHTGALNYNLSLQQQQQPSNSVSPCLVVQARIAAPSLEDRNQVPYLSVGQHSSALRLEWNVSND